MERVEHWLTQQDKTFRVVVHTADNAANPACAAVFGDINDGCLVRVHSRCLYSEAFGSEDCDCEGQLRESRKRIWEAGAGVVVYLDQEGRGSGLVAKARGYVHSQKTGADTFASYDALELPPDCRSYGAAADLLKDLGLQWIRLLTNNPDKIAALEQAGLKVEAEPLLVPVGKKAAEYLEAKRARGHRLPAGSGGQT